jgi:glycosyltransferase involved in cell wall biosynthesis
MIGNFKKLISFCVPSYNSAAYLHFAVDSLLTGGEDVEIILIDDGSHDETRRIADSYEAAYPTIVHSFHQPNGGHGEGINNALKIAAGIYFKVVDSDDWVDPKALSALLQDIQSKDHLPDLYVTDYVYWQGRGNRSQVIRYAYLFKKNASCAWGDLGKFTYKGNLTLHSTMYQTQILRSSKVALPRHVSYEDNFFVYAPMPYAKTIAYLPVSLYQYLVGREGQSMEHETCVRKYRDYILGGELVFDSVDVLAYRKTDPGLYRALYHHLVLNTMFAIVFARLNGSAEAKRDLKDFWAHLKASNPRQYRKLRFQSILAWLDFPGRLGSKVVKVDYKLAHQIIKFN